MDAPKERHGCLTLLLVVYFVVNGFLAVALTVKHEQFHEKFPSMPVPLLWVLAGLAVLNVALVVALFYWKKWAFFGIVVTSVIVSAITIYAGGILEGLPSLAGIAVLYGVLQIGGQKSGWAQMSKSKPQEPGSW